MIVLVRNNVFTLNIATLCIALDISGIWDEWFSFLHEICCGYSLEAPLWGASNEYPQQVFMEKKIRNMNTFWLKKHLTCIQTSLFNYMWLHLKLTLTLLKTTCPVLANSVDPDQLASEEANWSGSALFVIKYVNFYQKPGSSNLIGWKIEVGVASLFI